MCRSGRTSRCTSACGLMSRIATKPSAAWTWSPSAYRLQKRQSSGSDDPLLGDGEPARADEVAGLPLHEPGRVVVAVAPSGPVDEDDVVPPQLGAPVGEAGDVRGLAQARASLLLH